MSLACPDYTKKGALRRFIWAYHREPLENSIGGMRVLLKGSCKDSIPVPRCYRVLHVKGLCRGVGRPNRGLNNCNMVLG